MAKVTVKFTGRIEVPTQPWSDETTLSQIKEQAKDEVDNWIVMIKKGTADPIPVNFIKVEVTEVILDV